MMADYSDEVAHELAMNVDLDADEVAAEVRKLSIRARARQRYEAGAFRPPAEDLSSSLADDLAAVRESPKYRIDQLLGFHHNVTLTAQYKTGKTVMFGNLARALADGVPFLDKFGVTALDGTVGIWNDEMDRDDFIDYLRPMKIQRADGVRNAHLRGESIPLMSDAGAEWTVNWLKRHEVEVWLNDSWAKLLAWSGVNENDNTEASKVCTRIEQIMKEAGVAQFITTQHTGRAKHEEGQEHGRGASAVDGWVDARWVLTRQGDDRFILAEGRDVGLGESQLAYDPDTKLYSVSGGGGSRSQVRKSKGVGLVTEYVRDHPNCMKKDIKSYLAGNGVTNRDDQMTAIENAIADGAVHFAQDPNDKRIQRGQLGPAPDDPRSAAGAAVRRLANQWS